MAGPQCCIHCEGAAPQGSCTHSWAVSRRGPGCAGHCGRAWLTGLEHGACSLQPVASKMQSESSSSAAGGRGAVGLAGIQLRRSISCLPSLVQTSLCPRHSAHPLRSLPGSLPSPIARDQADIWPRKTQCVCSAGQGSAVRPPPLLAINGAPRCRLPPAPLPSPREPQLRPAPGPHHSPAMGTFSCTKAHQPPLQKQPCHKHVVTWLSPVLLTPIPAATAPLDTSLLQRCRSQDPALTSVRKDKVQTKPLLVPPRLAATRILPQGGDRPQPCAARALPLPTPSKRVWWLWAGSTRSWCLQHGPATRETLLPTPSFGQGRAVLSPSHWAL